MAGFNAFVKEEFGRDERERGGGSGFSTCESDGTATRLVSIVL